MVFTWKVGMVESINIIIDESRKRELTMTRTWDSSLYSTQPSCHLTHPRCRRGVGILEKCPDDTPQSCAAEAIEMVNLRRREHQTRCPGGGRDWPARHCRPRDRRQGGASWLSGECRHSRAPGIEHWGPSTPTLPQSPSDRRSPSGGAPPSCTGRECSRRSLEICRNRIPDWLDKRSHRGRESQLKWQFESVEIFSIELSSHSVVAYLSLWSLLLGNLSIVSHFTWWTVPPTLRITMFWLKAWGTVPGQIKMNHVLMRILRLNFESPLFAEGN